jgi:hypothetical protein
MSDVIKAVEGNTGELTIVLLNQLILEIQGLRKDMKKLMKPPAKAKKKK